MEVDFSGLLERSRALSSADVGFGRIPRLERQLDQIDRESRRILGSKSVDDAEDAGDGALRLLSEYGFEADKLERSLQSVALMDRLEPYESVDDTDLDAFLRHQDEMLILGALEENREQVIKASAEADDLAIEADWERLKREIVTLKRPQLSLEETNQASSSPSTFASPFRLLPQLRPSSTATKRARVDVLYGEVVKRIVLSRGSPAGSSPKIAKEFESVAQEERRGSQVEECFRIVKNIVNEDKRPLGTASEGSSPSAEVTLSGILRFLSGQFLERKLRATISSSPLIAKRGGEPGIEGDVRAYLNVLFEKGIPDQFREGATVNGLPLWPQLFYLLRSGYPQAASDLADRSEQSIVAEGCHFHHYLREFVNSGKQRMISEASFARLVQEYSVVVYRGSDAFRRVCYLLLTRVDASTEGGTLNLLDEDYSLLFNTIEDYLWFRLSLVRLESELPPPQSQAAKLLTLREVQQEIRSFGPAYFDPKGDRPFLYVQVLLLTAQYTSALEYISRSAEIDPSDAVHLVILQYYYGLIDTGDPPMDDDEIPKAATLPDLLWRYVRDFGKAYPRDASLYIFLLRDALWRDTLLRKLILDTREFDAIIGPPRRGTASSMLSTSSGSGALDELWHFSGEPMEAKTALIVSTAEVAEAHGDRSTAMQLFSLSGKLEKVLRILVSVLSNELTNAKSSQRRREALELAAEHERLLSTASESLQDTRLERSFHIIVRLCQFFDLKAERQFTQAWQTLADTAVLPLRDDQLIAKSIEWKDGSRDLTEDLTDRVGDILVAAMECLAEMYSTERRRIRNEGGVQARANIKANAQVLVNFAGILQLASDISAKIIRLEVLMS